MHQPHHLFVGVGPGYRQHLGVGLAHIVGIGAETAGHDHPAILRQRFADGLQRLFDGGVDETAGIDHHQVGFTIAIAQYITFGTQLAQYAFGIHQILRATQADETNLMGGLAVLPLLFCHDYCFSRSMRETSGVSGRMWILMVSSNARSPLTT